MKSSQCLLWGIFPLSLCALHAQTTELDIHTNLGVIPITLYDDAAPGTVANFLGYVERGDYDNTIFHRAVAGFVLQSGGYALSSGGSFLVDPVDKQDPIANEFGISNTRGTLAMAKLGGDPDSATSEWFINLDDNSANLDVQNGGFTVFGIVGNFDVVDEIMARPVINAGGAFGDLPLLEYDGSAIEQEDFIVINNITITSQAIAPEPSTLGLSGLAVLALLRRRRQG